MAYLAHIEAAPGAGAIALPLALPRAGNDDAPLGRLSALEWSVVMLARRDGLSTLREPGPIGLAMAALFGGRQNPRLTDERLEALRRFSVLAWHHGYHVPKSATRELLAAGFGEDQLETLLASVTHARAAARTRRN